MLKVLKDFYTAKLTSGELHNAGNQMLAAAQSLAGDTPAKIIQALKAALSTLEQSMGREQMKSDKTAQLDEIDDKRDALFILIRDSIRNWERMSFAAQQHEAARLLWKSLDVVGTDINRRGYAEQSAATAVLVEKLSAQPMQEALQTLALDAQFQQLKKTQKQFEQVQNERNAELAEADEYPEMRAAKSEVRYLIEGLMWNVDFAAAQGDEAAKKLAAQIDEITVPAMATVRAREARNAPKPQPTA